MVYLVPFSHGAPGDGELAGDGLVAAPGAEERGGPPPHPDIVFDPEVGAHKNASHFSLSKKWEAVHLGRRLFIAVCYY